MRNIFEEGSRHITGKSKAPIGRVTFHIRFRPDGYELEGIDFPDEYYLAQFIEITSLEKWLQQVYLQKLSLALNDRNHRLCEYEDLYPAFLERTHEIEGLANQIEVRDASWVLTNLADILRENSHLGR